MQDRDGRLVFANEAAARTLGFPSTEALVAAAPAERMADFEVLDEAGSPLALDQLPGRRALTGEEPADETVHYRVRSTGEERWSIVRTAPIKGRGGRVQLAITTFHDITDRVRAEQRLAFLAEATARLGASLEWEETLEELAHLAIPTLADWCIVDVLAEDGRTLRQVTVAAADPRKEAVLREMRARYRPTLDSPQPAARALRSGETQLFREFTPDSLRETARDEEHFRLLRELDPRAAIAVPLLARGHTVGALTLAWSESDRRYTDTDVALAEQLARRAALAVDNARLYRAEREAAAARAESFALLDTLLGTAPVGLGFLDRDFRYVRINDALAALNGLSVDEHVGRTIFEVVPELAAQLAELWQQVVDTGEPLLDLELSGTTPATGSELRHWAGSYYPVRSPNGEIVGIGVVLVDVTERKRGEEARQFMAESSTVLASSLDYETTLSRVARLAVPHLADWCTIDMLDESGEIKRLTVAHADPQRIAWAEELSKRFPIDPDAPYGVPNVIRTGRSELLSEIPDELLEEATAGDPELLEILRELGLKSSMCVPLIARGRVLGAITLISEQAGRRYTQADLVEAEELARRSAIAVDNSRLFHEAERRADAARVLAYVGDGVFLLDRNGVVRLWNRAAETITGLRAAEVVGRPVEEAVPGWAAVAERVPIAAAPGAGVRAETVPLELPDRELWLSVSGVGFLEGTVFAFRDLTEERALEQLKNDFVSTVSHELRTPLAAIYGAALTLRRDDLPLDESRRENLLSIVANEADRLARTVNDILWTSRLDSGTLQVAIESCDAALLAADVVAAAQAYIPGNIELQLDATPTVPHVAGDPDKVRQVLANLVDNAVKYSPDGGRVDVTIESHDGGVRFFVRDEGLGIPPSERSRIFDKFYRLDPEMTRGVGGTGLGLYICRELVRRMDGRIWVESHEGAGATFAFELPAAG